MFLALDLLLQWLDELWRRSAAALCLLRNLSGCPLLHHCGAFASTAADCYGQACRLAAAYF